MDIQLDQKLVQGLVIPPRPEVVAVLFEEMSRDEPDLMRVAKAISADVGLSGAMLKAVNSPLFGLTRKAQSVSQAINLLGLRNVGNIATGLVIRQTLNGADPPMLQRFWDTAEKVAVLCVYLAHRLRGIPFDEAYTYGLFHDCGIPLLMMRSTVDCEWLKFEEAIYSHFALTEEDMLSLVDGAHDIEAQGAVL